MQRWDIFCKVVDNYGDIGTCWRLAQQLADEHEADVRLWVDNLDQFASLCPAISPDAARQHVGKIETRHWQAEFPIVEAADVVIEAFACELPATYIAAMARRAKQPIEKEISPSRQCRTDEEKSLAGKGQSPLSTGCLAPVWINLEYLSAESWVEKCHLLPSPQAGLPLTKYFFFPGFTSQTGGLLRERGLLAARNAFDVAAAAEFWRSLSVEPPSAGELRVSLFCYDNAALPELLQCWAAGRSPVQVLAMPGAATEQIASWFGEALPPNTTLRKESLTAHSLPFLPQPWYDRLLWACDVNFVRGEDSFVRAQWGQRPFVWQIYPQAENTHLVKLDAFLTRYVGGFNDSDVVRRFWHAWNGIGEVCSAWRDYAAIRQPLEQHGKVWVFDLDRIGDLADNLVRFVRGKQISTV